jgi:hypothetical protein
MTNSAENIKNNPKLAVGSVKQGFQSIPPSALIPLAQAMDDGARKYGPMNWRESKVVMSIYLDAILRHAFSLIDGEDFAEDSGIHHLGHIMACAAIIIDAKRLGVLIDDRHIPGDFGTYLDEIYQKNKEDAKAKAAIELVQSTLPEVEKTISERANTWLKAFPLGPEA